MHSFKFCSYLKWSRPTNNYYVSKVSILLSKCCLVKWGLAVRQKFILFSPFSISLWCIWTLKATVTQVYSLWFTSKLTALMSPDSNTLSTSEERTVQLSASWNLHILNKTLVHKLFDNRIILRVYTRMALGDGVALVK